MKIQKNLLRSRGFTIVELLIVIVVIGVLAAITIVAYSGVQQRANNAAIINAANESVKALNAYYAIENKAPVVEAARCITSITGCVNPGGYATTVALDLVGTEIELPRSIPKSGTVSYGIRYHHTTSRTFNGVTTPVILEYYLQGGDQKCGVSNVMSGWSNGVTSTTGNSGNQADGKTACFVAVPFE